MMLYNNNEYYKSHTDVWVEAEVEWRERNNITGKKRGFIDANFLTWIIVNKKDDTFESEEEKQKYEEILWYIFDEMVRRLLASRKWSRFDNHFKDEMYQEAMMRLLNITDTYKKGSAFSYATTIITSGFKDFLMKEGKWKMTKKRLRESSHNRSGKLYGEVDQTIQSNIDSDLSRDDRINKGVVEEEVSKKDTFPTVPSITRSTKQSFYDDIIERLDIECEYKEIRLLTHPNLPIFKRIYREFNRVLVPTHLNINKKKLDLKTLSEEEKGQMVILELIDMEIINEDKGQSKNMLKDRVIRARNNGFQYFGIYSDDWWIVDELEDEESVRDHFIGQLNDMLSKGAEGAKTRDDRKYYPNLEYIEPAVFKEKYKECYKVDTFWGLDKNRNCRKFLADLKDYQMWLESDPNNTRIWSHGILDLRKKDEK